MNLAQRDIGTFQVLIARLNKFSLPRAIALKHLVDQGYQLSSLDIHFLEGLLSDMRTIDSVAARHPEYAALISQALVLYHHVTAAALANERKA